MKALCWHAKNDIRCDEVPDPKIEHPRDAIVKVTSCAICGSDLHLYDGFMPGMPQLFHSVLGRGRKPRRLPEGRSAQSAIQSGVFHRLPHRVRVSRASPIQ
jgi:hypothetical protein